jgi:hypothetical protein
MTGNLWGEISMRAINIYKSRLNTKVNIIEGYQCFEL